MVPSRQVTLLCLILSVVLWCQSDCFPTPAASRRICKLGGTHHASSAALFMSQDQDDDDEKSFLDKQFFVPSKVEEGSPLKWFANLVEQDYETAEALFACTIITVLVVISQELLRMQINPGAYVPFVPTGVGAGKLF